VSEDKKEGQTERITQQDYIAAYCSVEGHVCTNSVNGICTLSHPIRVDELGMCMSRCVVDDDHDPKDFNRIELTKIRNKAARYASFTTSHLWQRAYQRLADAADHLDAMMVRSMKE